MKEEYFVFKKWITLIYLVLVVLLLWFAMSLTPSAVANISRFSAIEDLYNAMFVALLIWLAVCEFGYNLMLHLSKGTAFELHNDYILVCTIFGLKKIPRQAVLGCKNPVHRMIGGTKSGLVIISVSPEYKVYGPYGFKINPQFYGASVVGETEQSIVKKIRAWRK